MLVLPLVEDSTSCGDSEFLCKAWKVRKPAYSTAKLLAARDSDEAHPLRTEEEATQIVEHLRRLEREQTTGTGLYSLLYFLRGVVALPGTNYQLPFLALRVPRFNFDF